jgi:hypothetical protein
MAEQTLYVRNVSEGGKVSYEEAMPTDIGVMDLTEHNQKMLEYYKSDGLAGSFSGVTCPSPECEGLMMFRSETIASNQLNLPAKREVICRECGRTGMKMI